MVNTLATNANDERDTTEASVASDIASIKKLCQDGYGGAQTNQNDKVWIVSADPSATLPPVEYRDVGNNLKTWLNISGCYRIQKGTTHEMKDAILSPRTENGKEEKGLFQNCRSRAG